MTKIKSKKWFHLLEFYLCPLILFLLPLRHCNQGIDIRDTGYNLACFIWFGRLDGMWVYVTYLANLAGHLFTLLPFGNTMIGMNVYCSLCVSLLGLTAWFFLRGKIPWGILFAGEILAMMMCWCPQVILYNYLTYLVLTAGTVLLYEGIIKDNRVIFLTAGFILGLGVGVRFSNLTHMALILGLWYDGWQKKKQGKKIWADTLVCVTGYLAGMGVFLLMIQCQYGLGGYFDMLFGLQTMSGAATGYSAWDMLTGAFVDYAGSMKWGLLFLGYMGVGLVFFRMGKGRCLRIKKILFVAGLLVVFRFVYGRGMFGFDYNTYFSMFWWISLFNTMALTVHIIALFRRDVSHEEKLLALLGAVTILILPLGSNNRSYPVINDLFLTAPLALYFLYRFLPKHFPVRAVAVGCLLMLAVQSAGFGMHFVFWDGTLEEKRDTKVENNDILKGMYTTQANARNLTALSTLCEREGLRGKPVILYGNIPGLSYILEMPCAITSAWPDLESYNMTFWNRDFQAVEADMERCRPVVIVGNTDAPEGEKGELLRRFLDRYNYGIVFENEMVRVYR